MTNQELQICVNGICLALQEGLGDYDLSVNYYDTITITHPEISNITLPSGDGKGVSNPRSLAKIIWELIDQIIQNGDEWLEQEKNYWVDRKENEEENNWESKRDYKD
jgi:hypothetical protein